MLILKEIAFIHVLFILNMHQEKNSQKLLSTHLLSNHLSSMMKEVRMNEDFSDVTLVTEDKKHL